MTTKTKAIMSLGLVAGLGAAVLPLASYADTHENAAEVQVNVAESITITSLNNTATGLSFSGADISAGTVKTGDHVVTVSTSAAAGYTLSMSAEKGTLNGLTPSSTPAEYGGAVGFTGIGAGTITAANPANAYNEATGTGVAFGATAPANGVWGYKMAGITNYASVPTSAFVIAASNAPAGAQATTVTFGAQAGTTTAQGTYGDWITYVAATN